jgi:ABC-2 type transport system ATP-binding protein
MDRGKVVADDTLRGLYRKAPSSSLLRVDLDDATGAGAWLADLRALPGVTTAEVEGEQLRVTLADLAAGAPVVLGWLVERKLGYSHFASDRPDLEAIFLSLTGRRLRD